jgi:NCAIR mutase (PurE)-related protein
MYKEKIKEILLDVRHHKIPVEKGLKKLEHLPYENLGFANIDHHRALRKGFPEVIFCQNKSPEQVAKIFKKMSKYHDVLATRASKEIYELVKKDVKSAEFNETSKTIIFRHIRRRNFKAKNKTILVVSAGTSDLPVAEEAAVTAEMMNNKVERLFDVGVAGIHRLLSNKKKIASSNVLIIVAGMDGVLASVVSGLVKKPVIAVPTSVGYGASFKGIGPLLTMLNSCSPGIAVVNIDNGFGAGYFASLINK